MIRPAAAAVVLLAMVAPGAPTSARGAGPVPGRPAAGTLEVLHYRTEDQLVVLPVRVGDSPPLEFVLDSGARHSIVDSTTARTLGLRVFGSDSTSGVGRGSIGLRHAAPLDLHAGRVTLHVEDPWVLDLRPAGREQGLLGADLFERYVVRIDPVRRTLTLMDPAVFRSEGAGAAVPLTLDDSDRLYVGMRLTVNAHLSQRRRMRIDTGSGDAASDNLVRRSAERRRSVQGVGLGAAYVDVSGVFQSVGIGPYRIEHVWGPSNDHPAVGMEILRRFTLTFDVSHRRLYLLPNRHLHDPVPGPSVTR